MILLPVIFLAVLLVAFANGANDNYKGVATLFGSGTTNYRGALLWGTVTTLLGSMTAVVLAGELMKRFTGRGLVADQLVGDAHYVAAVALGAGLTVLLATRIGMPISTTHGLVGALVGTAWAAGSAVNGPKLASDFFLPLLVSPFLAIGATFVCYRFFHAARLRLGVTEQTCFCVGSETIEVSPCVDHAAAMSRAESLSITTGNMVTCRQRYQGNVMGIRAPLVLDWGHYLSAGVVGYARGLNDTPKIAALLLVAPQFGSLSGTFLVAAVMAIGGLTSARRVAEIISHRITPMNHGQGFVANLVTGVIVVFASRLGVPVSTTHVSCGALFGIGTVTGGAKRGMIGKIATAWIVTLPVAAALGAISYGGIICCLPFEY